MKRIALVFILSILLPAVLLAVLAVRSLRDQELIVSSQRTQLHQSACDALAERITLFMNEVRFFHGQLVEELVEELAEGQGISLEGNFDPLLRARWGQASVSAVVSDEGVILSPRDEPGTRSSEFLNNHGDFLTNRRVVEIYQAPPYLGSRIQADPDVSTMQDSASIAPAAASAASAGEDRTTKVPEATELLRRKVGVLEKANDLSFSRAMTRGAPAPTLPEAGRQEGTGVERDSFPEQRLRNVMPMQQRALVADEEPTAPGSPTLSQTNVSALNPEAVTLKEITSEEDEGAVSRLINGELHVLLWKRHPLKPGLTFWTELDISAIRSDLAVLFSGESSPTSPEEVSLALLDSSGEVVAQTVDGFTTDWSTPFVASEIGQILPRWEVAAYLLDPSSLNASARTIRLTLWLITLTLLGAVAGGSFLILRSVNLEMRIASQKTDFVSNVSHELKTPLTSIRMFSELLRDAENPDPDKTRQYSGIISKESARLSRLINRLLDFSRLDRGEQQLRREHVDVSALVQETIEDYRPQLEAVGMAVQLKLPPDGGPLVKGDRDALSQVILNLLSNAEKYAASGGEVVVEIALSEDKVAVLSVRDRGPGIPQAHQRRIFDKFYRIDESISSGIEGSGIGLALSRQIVELHGGTIRYEAGKGGGSIFRIELPVISL